MIAVKPALKGTGGHRGTARLGAIIGDAVEGLSDAIEVIRDVLQGFDFPLLSGQLSPPFFPGLQNLDVVLVHGVSSWCHRYREKLPSPAFAILPISTRLHVAGRADLR